MNRALSALPLAALLLTVPAAAQDGPPSVVLEKAFPKLLFERPVDLQAPPDGSGRLFVAEQDGRVLVFPRRGDADTAAVFLDIRDRVGYDKGEMGLLGLAFHPRFKENRFLFVNYTADNPRRTVISRFEADPADPGRALASSEKIILEFSQPYRNHNGGQIGFGPDGYLYIAAGDGGSGGDPHGNGQNLGTLLGKILRIDVDRSQEGLAYAVPDDNPFRGRDGARGEVWAYGLRNPWRFSWDGQGRLWAADVGQDAVEEIDIVEKGKNYGWNVLEGSRCFKPASGCDPAGTALPVDEYTHEIGQSVTGGFVYAGKTAPSLAGAYVFADFVSGRVWALWYDKINARRIELLRNEQAMISSFGTDENRELYLCSFDGSIYRFKETTGPA